MNFREKLQWIMVNARDWIPLSAGEYNHSAPLEYDYTHFESTFVANEIRKHYDGNNVNLLDIGSYLHFVFGLCGSFQSVTSIDVKPYNGFVPRNLRYITCDAKKLPLPDKAFDMISSQCTLEHIGLGAYGDEFDFGADRMAVEEMKRVLKLHGFLILTTTIANTKRPVVMFNAHRIYNLETIHEYFKGMKLCSEGFYSVLEKRPITKQEVTAIQGGFDVYGSCWQKV